METRTAKCMVNTYEREIFSGQYPKVEFETDAKEVLTLMEDSSMQWEIQDYMGLFLPLNSLLLVGKPIRQLMFVLREPLVIEDVYG
jgi:hypothetical protein